MRTPFQKWLCGAAAMLAACLPMASQAEPYFPNKEGNLIWDKATNLVWQRCSVGQSWNGATCNGAAQKFSFDVAQQQAGNGWRLPTFREFASLVDCNSGYAEVLLKSKLEDGGPEIVTQCSGSFSIPIINTTAFPGMSRDAMWSSSPYVGSSRHAWGVGFGKVFIRNGNFRDSVNAVHLVRASQLSGSESSSDFSVSLNEMAQIAGAKRQEVQREEDSRARAQRSAAERSLVAGGAQAMYLQAGRAQRSGSVTVGDVSFNALELYEMIVDKFPKSEWAVKASDQLNAMDRTQRQSSAVRDADRNASDRAACFSQVNSCVASCRSSDMRYNVMQSCISSCQRNCN